MAKRFILFCFTIVFWSLIAGSLSRAQDLADIQKAGVLRHLAIPYANFYTGRAGDGLDVELTQGFAKELGVRYQLVETSWTTVFGDLTGRNAKRNR